MLQFFLIPTLVSSALLLGLWWFLGTAAFITALLLTVLEVTLSFDNAVVNARVLRRMSKVWQQRFLTWGMLIAVLGTRLILPILIVSAVSWTSPWVITQLALFSPNDYGDLLSTTSHAIHSFGAAFLIMVSLKYFFNSGKTEHWIKGIEERLTEWGKIESIEIGLTLSIIAALAFLVPPEFMATVLISGIIGIILFIAMEGITTGFSVEDGAVSGLALFLYLNVLDSAFSLDSVVGAFALTDIIPVIVVGLGIGAYFVRSLTLYMVREHMLDTLKYLEHGAHWAIFGLAVSMFVALLTEVPEVVTGSIGLFFVVAAYWSSVRMRA